MSHYRPKHRNKYFEFVEHTKPKRRRGRHAAALLAPYLTSHVQVSSRHLTVVDLHG